MNMKQLLVCAACLVFSGTALGQFKLVYDSGMERDYPIEKTAIYALNAACRMSPKTGAADLVEKSTGKKTHIDCAAASKMSREYASPKQKDEKARAAAVAATEKYKTFSKSKAGVWKEDRWGSSSMAKAEAQVTRLCVHGAGTVVAAKIVDQSGHETIYECSARK